MPPRSSPGRRRADLVQELDWALRDLSTSTVMSASAIAQRVGMGANDLKCAELLVRKGPLTAGQLAEESGLTTGAITGVVDRLEKAGWARRETDPTDRRKVIIRPSPKDAQTVSGLYDTYTEAMGALLGRYSLAELTLILGFVRQLGDVHARIATQSKDAPGPR
ncbi:MAG: MarR family transcriptional regulator [Anaerolineales bacterium]|nr:MarR family transcriptional regulator [Anaerolineales bacterium]